MTLQDLSNLSQLIAAVAVIISLVYAALQFRIYARDVREARLVTRVSDLQEFRRMLATDGESARIYLAGLKDLNGLDALEQLRFSAMMHMMASNMLYYRQFGSDFGGETEMVLRNTVKWPGFRQWWQEGRQVLPAPAVAAVDALIKSEAAAQGAPSVRGL